MSSALVFARGLKTRERLTILWNDMTVKWNDLAWNDLTMERSDRIPLRLLAEFISFFLSYVM